jgi:hypothetical protein
MPDRPPTFHEFTFDALRGAIAEVAADVPEVEAVGVVVLWRGLGRQLEVPSVLVLSADGAPFSFDQVLRVQQQTLELLQWSISNSAAGVDAVLRLARSLAAGGNADEPRTRQEAQTPPGTPEEPAGEDLHHDVPGDDR